MAPIVDLPAAKAHLNITTDNNDEELTHFIDVASDLVESAANRVWRSTVFEGETHHGGTDAIVLLHSPVSEITSIVNLGRTVSPSEYTLTPATGLVRLNWSRFTPGAGTVVVSYTAGAAEAPALAKHAVLETLRHLWTTQRGTVVRGQIAGDDYGTSATTYTLPMRVIELIDRMSLATGIG